MACCVSCAELAVVADSGPALSGDFGRPPQIAIATTSAKTPIAAITSVRVRDEACAGGAVPGFDDVP